ncbi:MAG: RAMP superfamily CRISPR-associated protein [Candidatus Helarchaeota archaeon]
MNGNKINLKLWVDGPIHFGMGTESTTGSDLGILYINNQIFIPGSSIKGTLRTAVLKFCNSIYKKNNIAKLKCIETCDPWKFEGQNNHYQDHFTCPVCSLFGWQDQEGKLRVNDVIIDINDKNIIEFRNSIRINRVLKTTERKMLMQFEYLYLKNTPFNPITVDINIIKPLSDFDYTLLHFGSKLINKIGGQSSKGLGKIEKVELIIPKKIDYNNVLKQYVGD